MRFTELKIDQDLKFNDFYNKRIVITNAENKPLRFQIPRMYMPFGLSGFTPEIGPTKWNVDFSMNGWNEENNYIKRFYDFIRNVEKYICDHIQENSLEIFGKSDVDVSEIFNSNIKEDTRGRDPKFRLKVDTDQYNKIKPNIYDINENNLTNTAEKGLYSQQSGVALVELSSVYFLNKKCGLTWKMCQMKVYEPQRLHGLQIETDVELKGFQIQV